MAWPDQCWQMSRPLATHRLRRGNDNAFSRAAGDAEQQKLTNSRLTGGRSPCVAQLTSIKAEWGVHNFYKRRPERWNSGSFLLCRKAIVVKCGASAERLQRVRWAPLKQTSGLQGHLGGGRGDLASNDLGTDSGWKQSRQNQTPLRGDETRSPNPTVHLDTALAAQLHCFPIDSRTTACSSSSWCSR